MDDACLPHSSRESCATFSLSLSTYLPQQMSVIVTTFSLSFSPRSPNPSFGDSFPSRLTARPLRTVVGAACIPSVGQILEAKNANRDVGIWYSTNKNISVLRSVGKLTELAVLTSTSPQGVLEGSYNASHPQSCSWNNTPNPITPPACTGLQALISAAALTASPMLSDGANADNHTTPSWDLHQSSPCLPLGLQPLPQQKIETPNEPTRRRNGSKSLMEILTAGYTLAFNG